jgi:hypothetical protein
MGDDASVILADVYPKAAGGTLTTLCCKKCDNVIGSRYDSHQATYHQWHDALGQKGEGKVKGKLIVDSTFVHVDLARTNDNAMHFNIKHDKTRPKADQDVFDKMAAGDSKFKFIGPNYSRKNIDVALLHSAFLLLFREFGYEYVLSGMSIPVRKILLAEKAPDEPFFISLSPPHDSGFQVPPYMIGIINDPADMRCLMVTLPSADARLQCTCVLLPGFGEIGSNGFKKLWENSERNMSFGFKPISGLCEGHLSDPEFAWSLHRCWYWL